MALKNENAVYWILSISIHQTAAHWATLLSSSSSSLATSSIVGRYRDRDSCCPESSSSLSVSDSVSSPSSSGGLRRLFFGGSTSTSESSSSSLPASKVGCLDLGLVVFFVTTYSTSLSSSSEESSCSSEESTSVSRAFNVLRRCRTGREEEDAAAPAPSFGVDHRHSVARLVAPPLPPTLPPLSLGFLLRPSRPV